MSQIKIFLAVFTLMLLLAQLVVAQTDWQKYEGNPVIIPTESWDYAGVLGPRVIKRNGLYMLWYTGLGIRRQICLATSTDGSHWTKVNANPVLRVGQPGTFDDEEVTYGQVLFYDNKYWMWYAGHDGDSWQIGLANSQDGVSWVKHIANPVLRPGDPGTWDAGGVIAPFVIRDGDIFKMWYNGNGPIFTQAGGYAESPDGIHWQKYNGNPVFVPIPGTWESSSIGMNTIVLDNGMYHLWYGANTSGLGYATSHDGLHWERFEGNPIVRAGAHNAWDTALGGFMVLPEHDSYKMWYSGNASTWQIGYAESVPVNMGNFALQFDGIDDRVSLPKNFISTPAAITLEAWVKYASNKGYMLALSFEGVYAFFLNRFETGTFTPFFDGATIKGNDFAYGAHLNDNQWHHLAAVNAHDTLRVFIDGAAVGAVPELLYDINTLDRAAAMGSQFDGSEFYFEGTVDEVRVWNVARSKSQIQENMYHLLVGNESGLIGYWRLDEGKGQFTQDHSPSGFHGHLGAVPTDDASDPQWVLVERGSTPACSGINLPAAEVYGNLPHGDQTHVNEVMYCFPAQTGDKYLTFEVFDIDQPGEVEMHLNGEHVLDPGVTANNGWSSLIGVLLSGAQMHNQDSNTLVFDNQKNPPNAWRWGVRRVSVDPFYALPAPAAYGKIREGDQSHPDKVVYFFSGQPGDLSLSYEAYDIDHEYELDIVLNGTKICNAAVTPNETWSEKQTLQLPDEWVYDTAINVLIFENTQNPPRAWFWGVRNVSVAPTAGSSIALNPAGSMNLSGSHFENGQFLLDGRRAPLVRPQGDSGTIPDQAPYVIEGATTIAPNGYAVIEFPAVQRFDYLAFYPEWHPYRFYNYRVEVSAEGSSWQTVSENSHAYVHGPQLVALPNTRARFVRLQGSSCVINVDSLQALGLSEEAYGQAQKAALQHAVPQDLALAELSFIQTLPTVGVHEPESTPPLAYALEQNIPNPFNPDTQIRFSLPTAGPVYLAVYNVRGELVHTIVTGQLAAGNHAYVFEGKGLASGVYLYRLQTEGFTVVRKMLLAK